MFEIQGGSVGWCTRTATALAACSPYRAAAVHPYPCDAPAVAGAQRSDSIPAAVCDGAVCHVQGIVERLLLPRVVAAVDSRQRPSRQAGGELAVAAGQAG